MIEYRRDNLLEADAEALVNTVNTVGVMGKGIALQFKKKFKENFKAYERAYKRGEVEIGKMFTFPMNRLTNPRYIINFPTKQHWREKSRLEYVREGLDDLLREIKRLDISSVAIPPLGCGNGGLDWETEVRPLIQEAFAHAPGVRAYVYEPSVTSGPVAISTEGPKPDLTPARAVMLDLIAAYKASHYTVGRLVAQKLAYFAQVAGEDSLSLEFKTGKFGPYADELRFLLQTLEGHYITGLGGMSGRSEIELLPGAEREAEDYLRDHPDTEGHLERVAALIEGFETPYGMELLATVHWAVAHKGATTFEEALRIVQDWSPRKGDLFGEEHVAVAWEHLEEAGWMPTRSVVR
ncbi:Appr-1-p processing protein [Rubrobacter marinus]|uniref:Appr-1-p processing protein n=1 Tax=Rubrobacter marinus TaxID=2653852 RepID=A0A6G8Q239_9ACTN|nr:macro domain-containing protein [Rubrobacter marinus]QIN80505.1 Appr-1-p processing protein [Rubrobacter marinus]